jgi:hypothetical protein
MSRCKTFGLAVLAAVCLLGEKIGSAHAQNLGVEWSGGSIRNLGGLPGSTGGEATGINDAGHVNYATEWSGAADSAVPQHLPGVVDADG